MRTYACLLAVFCCAVGGSCAAEDEGSFTLTARFADLAHYFPTYLANGHFSLASTPLGTDGADSQIAGVMEYAAGDVSRPAGIPSWNEIDYFDGSAWLNAQPPSEQAHEDYRQTLNMRSAELETRYRWHSDAHVSNIVVKSFVSEAAPHLAAVRFALTPEFSGKVRLRLTFGPRAPPARQRLAEMNAQQFEAAAAGQAALSGNRDPIWYPGYVAVTGKAVRGARRSLQLSGRALGGAGIELAATAALSANFRAVKITALEGQLGFEIEATVSAGQHYTVDKFVAAASDSWPAAVDVLADAARAAGFSALESRHAAAWRALWRSDVKVQGNADLQRTLHSDLFYLLENTSEDEGWPAAACGFSSHYFGHVFWDNDFWVFPALLLLHPERALHLIEFRGKFLNAAKARARAAGQEGAMYPWEADPAKGTEVTPRFAIENADREIHVNGAVALAQWQYYLQSGDRGWLRRSGYPVIAAVADFWAGRVSWNEALHRYELKNVTSPEEDYLHVDNEIYTNVVARQSLLAAVAAARALGLTPKTAWADIAARLYLPTRPIKQRYYEFDPSVPHDKRTSWMATSVPMLSIPAVGFATDAQDLKGLFEHSASEIARVRDRANQMILVMVAIEAAQIGNMDYFSDILGGRAHDVFLKPPFNVRSETPQNNSTYLLASSGGFVQAFVYGLTGLRLDEQGLKAQYPASLPQQVSMLKLVNIQVRSRHGDVVLTRTSSGAVSRAQTWHDAPMEKQ